MIEEDRCVLFCAACEEEVGNDGFPGAVGSACWVGSVPGVVVAFVGPLFVFCDF